MKRRHSKTSPVKLAAYAGGLLACSAFALYAAMNAYGTPTPDKLGCYDGVDQAHTLVLVDASTPRWSKEAARSLWNALNQTFNGLAFNERLSVFTSEGDAIASVLEPRFSVCGPARRSADLEAIGAEPIDPGFLKKQAARLYEKVLRPELDALLALEPEEARRQNQQSPVMELLRGLSRRPEFGPGARVVLISDLLQNSPTSGSQFCAVKGHMPSFATYARRETYQNRLAPRSFEGVGVEVLLLQRLGYGEGHLKYCTEGELERFWKDYFAANGADRVEFITIRQGLEG